MSAAPAARVPWTVGSWNHSPVSAREDGDDLLVEAGAQPSDVDHHVDFARTVGEGLTHLGDLRGGRGRAVRKADHGSDGDSRALEAPDGVRNVARAHAHAEHLPLGGDVEFGVDICPGELGLEDRVVDGRRDDQAATGGVGAIEKYLVVDPLVVAGGYRHEQPLEQRVKIRLTGGRTAKRALVCEQLELAGRDRILAQAESRGDRGGSGIAEVEDVVGP